ncbi:MAG: Response regulator ArlR [Syntrophus sp. PtaB.Bin001]|nr:MAG: Response regulator ArlR [Syntrophus sp. PtaB.Bin001]
MKILIVDDHEETADLLEASASLWGHFADKVYNGRQAMEMLRQHSYDVLITDAQMPEMSGFELCRYARDQFPDMFIIGITGSMEFPKFKEAGADIFFKKPFDFDELEEVLKNVRLASRQQAMSNRGKTIPLNV